VIETPAGLIVPATAPTVAAPDAVVMQDREFPKEWLQRLREVSPVNDIVSWLEPRWLARYERWALYECVPIRYVDDNELIAELSGPDPDSPEGEGMVVSRFQQEMFKKYRVHARLSWIIQGNTGGHQYVFGESTKELCRAKGIPVEPPKPGDLPYAPFDERVVQQILRMSKLAKVRNDLGEFKKRYGKVENWKREDREAMREARQQYVQFINAQFGDDLDEFKTAYRKGELEGAPKTEQDYDQLNEAADARYVETGRF
jgi:hypothetical protein